MKKRGFTLAEVLITLAVIGVVAALTIPTVVRNYQKTQAVTQLKKEYSALANTTNLAIADYGPITEWEIGELNNGDDAEKFANTYMIPYLKIAKNCGSKETTGDCSRLADGAKTRFYLADGTLIWVESGGYTGIVWVCIDVNGRKKPDELGKDMFEFKYFINRSPAYNGKFLPECFNCSREYLTDDPDWGCNKDGGKQYCTALIMQDSWQMKDDYPW